MNVVIVAGGNGTRFKDLSVFPKILLPLKDSDSILSHDVKLFGKINLIINSRYHDMVKNYIETNNLRDKVKLFKTDNSNGSYNSILDCKSRYLDFPFQDVLFVWSDLIIDKKPEVNENTIFTCSGHYRYSYDGEKIESCPNYDGNVPGIYYIKDLDDIFKFRLDEFDDFDLIDAIITNGQKFENGIASIYMEMRDYQTYCDYAGSDVDCNLKTRFFNQLSILNGKLEKQAIDPKYYDIIEKEFKWYEYGYNNIDGFWRIVPNIDLKSYKNHSFMMEYLDKYVPLHKCLKENIKSKEEAQELYSRIKSTLDILNSNKIEVSRDQFEEDLKKEVIDKVFARCENIKHMLVEYDDFEMVTLLEEAYDYLMSLEKNSTIYYAFTHGDINGSNMLVDPKTFDVKLIDPRGYFGNTKLYGWQPYEYAKLLYCLYGYDDFNNNLQIYKRDWPKKLEWAEDIDWLNKKEYKVLVGVIYVALAGYISQDIIKANIAYEYGMQLLRKELEDVQ